jgi:hypothetical protein
MRTSLVQTANEDYVLLLTLHHIISDGWSLGILLREVLVLYETAIASGPAAAESLLPTLPVQYADFALWQRAWVQGEVLEEMLSYWRRQLADLPVFELQTDYPRPVVQRSSGATCDFQLSPTLSEGLRALSQRERATLFMTLLAAFKTLLFRYTGQEDVVVGSNIASRNLTETEGLIGFFVNTIVLRTTVRGEASFRQLLHDIRSCALDAQAYQDTPFEMLVEALDLPRDPSRTPLFQIMFVFQNMALVANESASLTISSLEVASTAAKFDLTLFMRDNLHGIEGTVEYNTDLFAATTIARLCTHFQTIIESIVADPDCIIHDLSIEVDDESREQLDEFYR